MELLRLTSKFLFAWLLVIFSVGSLLSARLMSQEGPTVAAPAASYAPTSEYRREQVQGFTVLIHQAVDLPEHRSDRDAGLRLLEDHLYRITRVVPPAALLKLQEVPLWMEWDHPKFPCMCYHVSVDWLRDNGVNPDKARAVEIANLRNFLEWTHEQPWMVLHELAHAYHDRVLGFDNPSIAAGHQRAVESGQYQQVLHINGTQVKHYALTDPSEYFAEASEAYFGTNDFYPFVRAELSAFDRAGFELIVEAWGAAEKGAGKTANDKTAEPEGFKSSANDVLPRGPQKLQTAYLPNAWQLNERIISGGLPEGPEGFAELVRLGVKTVISVDGAQPQIDLAKQVGLRYIHMPHGYEGVPEQLGRELAKAVLELPGPVYIHCHLGMHRSPAAAAIACQGAGWISPAEGLAFLKLAGTSEHYRGLIQSVRSARSILPEELDQLKVDYHEVVKVPPLAESMIAMEATLDRLKTLARHGWRTPAEQPDLEAAHQGLLLLEHYKELSRLPEIGQRPADFQERLQASQASSETLEALLQSWEGTRPPELLPELDQQLTQITQQCKACHERHRDNVALPRALQAQ